MAGRHRSDHVAIKVPDEPGSPTHSRHAGHALRGQSACPRPQYPTLRGNRTIKNEAKEKPRIGNIRFYPPATRRQANILHRTAKTCTSTPSANNFLPPRQLSGIARHCQTNWIGPVRPTIGYIWRSIWIRSEAEENDTEFLTTAQRYLSGRRIIRYSHKNALPRIADRSPSENW